LRPLSRRSFALSLAILPLTCLGCGASATSVNPAVGEKRRRKMEELQKKAESQRKTKK
jgi:hypothetical protein